MKKQIFTKLKRIFFAFFIMLFISCETDIPETDTTAPTFSFNISGDGFNWTFDQDDDLSGLLLKLRTNTEYRFIYSGSDAGGVERISWQYPHDFIEFSTDIPAPWENATVTPVSSIVYWEGDAANPTTGNILNGRLVTNGDVIGFAFYFFVRDFGGSDGLSNITEKILNIYIDENDTEIIGS